MVWGFQATLDATHGLKGKESKSTLRTSVDKHCMMKLIHCIKVKRDERTYIKENGIAIGISIIPINTIKSLWKLHIADIFPKVWIHHKAHSFSQCLAVVYVVITVNIQQVRCI